VSARSTASTRSSLITAPAANVPENPPPAFCGQEFCSVQQNIL
jgi:hypothetical protein